MSLSSKQIADILIQVSEANLPCAELVVKLVTEYQQYIDKLSEAVSETSGPVGERGNREARITEYFDQCLWQFISIDEWLKEKR